MMGVCCRKHWKERDCYDSSLKGWGLWRPESLECCQDGNEGCCLLIKRRNRELLRWCVVLLLQCCFSLCPSQLLFSHCLFGHLLFSPLVEVMGNGRVPESKEGVNEETDPQSIAKPPCLVWNAGQLRWWGMPWHWFNCILVTNWVWSGCPVR